MDYFIPSEIARLVLGYLKEEKCTKSYNVFVNECVHLREYATHLRHGQEYPTTIADMSLKQILNEYGKHKQHETRLKKDTLDGLWFKLDALITQLRGRCSLNTPSAAVSSGHHIAMSQGQRFNRNRRPNAMGAVAHSRASAVKEVEQCGHQEPLPGSPAPTEEALGDGTVDSDSEEFVMEPGQAVTPSGRCRNRQGIRTLSPRALGGILVDISQVDERCQDLDYSASFTADRQDHSLPQSDAVPSTSTKTKLSQENTFTNHQRKAAADSRSNVQRVKGESGVKPRQTKSPKPRKGKRQVQNGSQEEAEVITTQQSTAQSANEPDYGTHTEPTRDCLTPKKSDPRSTAIAIGKSPRRKGPAPKRRSACWDDLTGVPQPITTNSNSSNEDAPSVSLSMPCFDDLVNNLNLAEKLAQTINVVKQSAESAALNTAPALVQQTSSQPEPDTEPRPASPQKKQLRRSARRAKKETKPAAAVSAEPMELGSEENIGNVLHIQDNLVTQEAVKSILEMTKSDPDFDVLFHMFSSDKPINFDEVENAAGLTQTSLQDPVASTSADYVDGDMTTSITADYQASPQTATVLHPGMHGQPDYVETVKVSAIQEVTRTPTSAQGEDCFKIPDPPQSGKSRDTSPNTEESFTSVVRKSAKGGNRKRKAKTLGVPRRKRSNSTDSSDSAGSEPGPAQVGPSPGLAHVASSPGFRHAAPSPGLTHVSPSPGLRHAAPSPGLRHAAPSPGLAHVASSPGLRHAAPSPGLSQISSSPGPTQISSSPGPRQIFSSPIPTYDTTALPTVVPSPLLLTSQVNHIMSRAAGMVESASVENQADQMSPEMVQDVVSKPTELNMNQYAVVDLGHVQTPATISLVTSDGTETAVASTVMPNFNIMAELASYTPASDTTVPVYQEAGSVQQHQLPQQQVQQHQLMEQQVQKCQAPQQQQVQQHQFLQEKQMQQGQLLQQQQIQHGQLPQQQQIQQEQLPQQQQIQQEHLQQQQFQEEELPQRQQIQQRQQKVVEEQLPQQQQVQREPLTEAQEAEQAASMLQSVYQLEPTVSTSLTYTSPQGTTSAAPTSSLPSAVNQAATAAVAAPNVETLTSVNGSSSQQLGTAPVLPTVPSPSSSHPPAQSVDEPSVSRSQASRSVNRCLYADEKTPTARAISAGKVSGVTPLVGSPFYSHPETPTLGAQEVVGSNSPATTATPAPPKSAAQQPPINETPLSRKSQSGGSLAKPSSFTGKSLTNEFLNSSPGSARTRYTWPRIQSRSAAKRAERAVAEAEATVSVPPAETETKLESPTKENKTPEKVPPQGGGTPLATKEAEVAATMVAMATTPVKDRDGPLYSYLPAGNETDMPLPDEQQKPAQSETLAQSETESNTVNVPNKDRVYKTPKKQRLRTPNVVSPIRSPLLKSLIQVSAGALLNGHNGTGGSPTRGSPVKRRLNSEKGKDVKHSKSKRPKIAKMDVDKFLERVHSPIAQ